MAFTKEGYKKVKFDEMVDFISTEHPGDKAWFKKIAFEKKNGEPYLDKKGNPKYNHLNAKYQFYSKYFPSELPAPAEKKESVNVIEKLKDW